MFHLPLLAVPFAAAVATVGIVTHVIVVRWVITRFALRGRARAAVIAVACACVLLPSVARTLAVTWRSNAGTFVLGMALLELVFIGVLAMPLLAMQLVEVARVRMRVRARRAPPTSREPLSSSAPASLAPRASLASSSADSEPAPVRVVISRRLVLERAGGAAAAGVAAGALGWGIVRGRHAFEIDEVVVPVRGLPRALDGYAIAQISDLHTGAFVGERELAEGLARVREARADLLVVTGDLVDVDPRFAPLVARALRDAAPRDGVFAAIGNHDYYAGVHDVTAALVAAGVGVLLNEGTRIRPRDGGGFALLGVDDQWALSHGGPGADLARAVADVPRDLPRILLAHQPMFFERAAGDVALQLSGHMHGGQINPGFRPMQAMTPYVAGRFEKRSSVMWVNRGFGTSGPPSRVASAPEITKVILVSA